MMFKGKMAYRKFQVNRKYKDTIFRKLFGENRISGPAASALVRIQEIASHAFSDLLDAAVFLLRKIVFKKLIPPDADGERNTLSYRIGRSIDRIAVRQGTEKYLLVVLFKIFVYASFAPETFQKLVRSLFHIYLSFHSCL